MVFCRPTATGIRIRHQSSHQWQRRTLIVHMQARLWIVMTQVLIQWFAFHPSGDRIGDICKIVQQKAVQRIVFRLGFVGLDWL